MTREVSVTETGSFGVEGVDAVLPHPRIDHMQARTAKVAEHRIQTLPVDERRIDGKNYFKPAAWHDAMPAALESSSAYAITAIAFDENRRANPNLITLTTHADANVRCVAAT